MKLKLTHSEFTSLHMLLKQVAEAHRPQGMQVQMLHSILCDIYEKFYRKAFQKKPKYSVSLKDHEAIGLWYFFEKYPFEPDQLFECNLVHTIRNAVHQKLTI